MGQQPNQQSDGKQQSESPDSNLKQPNNNAPKNIASAPDKQKDSPDLANQDPKRELFDEELADMDEPDANNPAYIRGADSSNKHQFLDNLDAEIGINDDDEDEDNDGLDQQ